ncbi:hypothetical protein NDU88_012310 [Pleurodeles waltl]|uniref:Uncharacterized protein n=1 Tax=Pleurodeles waltl TaxID=8319 RepID=A0AAV7R5K1_PLEWA|nr:hypothetical protein NDU88_012310 [Pleurodeles waltl]
MKLCSSDGGAGVPPGNQRRVSEPALAGMQRQQLPVPASHTISATWQQGKPPSLTQELSEEQTGTAEPDPASPPGKVRQHGAPFQKFFPHIAPALSSGKLDTRWTLKKDKTRRASRGGHLRTANILQQKSYKLVNVSIRSHLLLSTLAFIFASDHPSTRYHEKSVLLKCQFYLKYDKALEIFIQYHLHVSFIEQ